MAAQIKIIRFQLSKRDFIEPAEREIAGLLSQGYTIVGNGGAGQHAYVILQKDTHPQRPPQQRPA